MPRFDSITSTVRRGGLSTASLNTSRTKPDAIHDRRVDGSIFMKSRLVGRRLGTNARLRGCKAGRLESRIENCGVFQA